MLVLLVTLKYIHILQHNLILEVQTLSTLQHLYEVPTESCCHIQEKIIRLKSEQNVHKCESSGVEFTCGPITQRIY